MYELSFYIPETNTVHSGTFSSLADAKEKIDELAAQHPTGHGSIIRALTDLVYQVGTAVPVYTFYDLSGRYLETRETDDPSGCTGEMSHDYRVDADEIEWEVV